MRSLRSALVHRFDGPPAKRNIGKVIALAVLGGLAAQIPFIVVTAYVYAGLTTHMMVVAQGGNRAGSLMPRLRACELFYKWERTHDPNLLNRAVADARISRVPWQSKLPFRTSLGGLRRWTQAATSAHSPATIDHYEHAVQDDCNYVASGLNWDRAKFRRDAAKPEVPLPFSGDPVRLRDGPLQMTQEAHIIRVPA